MTDFEKWKAFLTEQNVGFLQRSDNGITPVLWLTGENVENFWAACEINFNDDGSLDKIVVSE
jgi:hypothetical protein